MKINNLIILKPLQSFMTDELNNRVRKIIRLHK